MEGYAALYYWQQVLTVMPQKFVTFQKFNTIESAKAMADFLVENNIAYEIDDERNYFDISYSFNKHDFDIKLKIASADFDKANTAIEQYYASELNSVEEDYYLFQFTDDELLEIISKPDEWGLFDYLLAKKILISKQIDISNASELKNKRVDMLTMPVKSPVIWIILGYLSSVLFFVWFYIIGIALSVGVTLAFLKRTLPNGKTVYYFDDSSRKNGKMILIITITLFIVWAVFLTGLFHNI